MFPKSSKNCKIQNHKTLFKSNCCIDFHHSPEKKFAIPNINSNIKEF